MRIQVEIPIATCARCLSSYTLREWHQLELVPPPKNAKQRLERRICSRCQTVMAYDVEGLDECDLTMAADHYERLYPDSDRPARARAAHALWLKLRRRRRRRRLLIAAAVAALVAAAFATVLWCVQ